MQHATGGSESNHNVVRFSSFTAHELANPLSALRMAILLLQEDPAEFKRGELLSRCTSLVEQMVTLTEDLRALGATQRPCREAVSAERLVNAVLERLEVPANICLVLPARSCPGVVRASPHLLTYAIRNLVRNAAEAMDDGGTVGVDAEVRNDSLHLTVWDDGPGVAP